MPSASGSRFVVPRESKALPGRSLRPWLMHFFVATRFFASNLDLSRGTLVLRPVPGVHGSTQIQEGSLGSMIVDRNCVDCGMTKLENAARRPWSLRARAVAESCPRLLQKRWSAFGRTNQDSRGKQQVTARGGRYMIDSSTIHERAETIRACASSVPLSIRFYKNWNKLLEDM